MLCPEWGWAYLNPKQSLEQLYELRRAEMAEKEGRPATTMAQDRVAELRR